MVRRKIGSNLGGKIRVRVSVEVVKDELLLRRGRGEEEKRALGRMVEEEERGD